jgi:hypothetical protein
MDESKSRNNNVLYKTNFFGTSGDGGEEGQGRAGEANNYS